METKPKLRPVDARWVNHQGQPTLMLSDRMRLSDQAILVPRVLAQILPLCDGTHDLNALRSIFELRAGVPISLSIVQELAESLDEALLLDSPRFQAAYREALEAYRRGPSRPAALAGHVYPPDPEALVQHLDQYGNGLELPEAEGLRGVVCPHIDYARGGPTYAAVWRRAADAARQAELVVVFGTDHAGGPALTLTRQSYGTPWGVLPTDLKAIDSIAAVLGEESAFSNELNHRDEHSIEAAAVWLHYVRKGRPCAVVPILCGGLDAGANGSDGDAEKLLLTKAMEALRDAARGRQVLAVAAADLAHVGPAFGDPAAFGQAERSGLASYDRALLAELCRGDADDFLYAVMANGDGYRICGLPPIYAMLRFLGKSQGEVTGYAQCPADNADASFVSIAGAVLW